MLRFEDPIFLWLLLLLPLLIIIRIAYVYKRKKALLKFGDIFLLRDLMPDISVKKRIWKFSILLSILGILIIILARPQMGSRLSHEKRKGIEVIISMDISNSMLSEDVIPSRLDKSKMLVEDMVDKFTQDKVGLVLFAGDAFVQLPITSDYVSAKMFLHNAVPSLIATQGTDIAKAINLSVNSFTQQSKIGRAIIVITDGEDHEGGVLDAAKNAFKKGIRVFVLGVGTSKGGMIPDGKGGYLKDNAGQVILSTLNEDMCRQIAQAGGGAYIHVDNTNIAQEQLNNELAKLQKGESTLTYSEYDEQFQSLAIIAIILLIIEPFIGEIKSKWLQKVNLFKRKL